MCKNDEVKGSLYSKEEETVRKPWKTMNRGSLWRSLVITNALRGRFCLREKVVLILGIQVYIC